jgi:hypothetical protein
MKCSNCGEMGHRPTKCPELYKDLDEGFYQGGGGGHSHDGDCEDGLDRVFSEDLMLARATATTCLLGLARVLALTSTSQGGRIRTRPLNILGTGHTNGGSCAVR